MFHCNAREGRNSGLASRGGKLPQEGGRMDRTKVVIFFPPNGGERGAQTHLAQSRGKGKRSAHSITYSKGKKKRKE